MWPAVNNLIFAPCTPRMHARPGRNGTLTGGVGFEGHRAGAGVHARYLSVCKRRQQAPAPCQRRRGGVACQVLHSDAQRIVTVR